MDVNELYSAAQRDGVLNLFASGTYTDYRHMVDRFKEKFPGIRVNLNNGHSTTLAGTIDAQRAGGRLEADVALLESVWDFDRWAAQGDLVPFAPEGFDQVMPSFKDAYGAYVGVRVNGLVYARNADLVGAFDMPRSALDFLDPKFRGKLLSGLPQRDSAVLYLFHTIIEKYGWRYADRLIQNQVTFAADRESTVNRLAEGEFAVALGAVAELCLADRRRGGKLRIQVPTEDPMPVWAQLAAIFTGAPHPAAAKLFVAWCLSREEQQRIAANGMWSAREDVAAPESLMPLASYRLANRFREFMGDKLRHLEMRRRFERHTTLR